MITENTNNTTSNTALVRYDLPFEVAAEVMRAHPAFGPESCSTIAECFSDRELIDHLRTGYLVEEQELIRLEGPRAFSVVTELVMQFTVEQVFWEREAGWENW